MTPRTDTDRITQGTLRTSTGQVLPLEHTDVKATIAGPVASVELEQVFRNDTGGPIEAVYLFPLPHEASVYRMSFTIGERIVKGVVKEKEEARRAYQAARAEGRAATLLEQDRPNLFTLSVANIPPGETITVDLAYQEKVAFDEGEWRFVFPMVAAERYHPGAPVKAGGATAAKGGKTTDQVPDGSRIRPPRADTGHRRADISLEVEVRAGGDRPIQAPRSPSHDVAIETLGDDAFRAKLHPSDSIPNRDFVLAWGEALPGVRAQVHFERTLDRVGTFLLVVTPPAAPLPEEAITAAPTGSATWRPLLCGNCGGACEDPGAVREVAGIGAAFRCTWCGAVVAASEDQKKKVKGLSRDVVLLVDRSCSMRGQSLPQARRAVRMILDHLGPNDAVQCIAFDHDRTPVDGIGEAWLPLDRATVNRIDEFLGGIAARGGTELEEALERAAKLPLRPLRARLVVLITDGALGNEGRLLRRAPEILGAETRLYVLGLGPAVNRYLVERLARACGGASDVLVPREDVEVVVPRFARRVRQAGPVLKDLRLTWDDALTVDVYPQPAPELFGGQTVQLLGRFNGVGKSRLVLTGTTALGDPFRQEIDVDLPEASAAVPGLERLWARLRIDALVDRLAKTPEALGEVRMEVLGLALRHSLLSPYTALVAEDSEVRVAPGTARRVDVPLETPGGEGPRDLLELREADVDSFETVDRTTGGGVDYESDLLYASDEPLDPGSFPGSGAPLSKSAPMFGAVPMPRSVAPPMAAPRPRPPQPMPAGGPPMPQMAMQPPITGAPPPPSAPGRLYQPEMPASREPVRPRGGGGLLGAVKKFFSGYEATEAPADLDEGRVTPVASPPAGVFDADADEDRATSPGPLGREADRPVFAGRRRFTDDDTPRTGTPLPPEAFPTGSYSALEVPKQAPGPAAPSSDPYPPEVLDWVKGRAIGEIDLVFLVDETGSMGPYIEEVKRRLLEIIEALRRAPLCRSLRLGIVSYRDHPPEDSTFASRVVPLTDDVEAIRKGVMRMEAAGGGDGPESVTDGLYDVVRLDWRPRAARVVVWVGDAPPHGVEPYNDGFPEGCPCGHHWFTQAENGREMGVVIHAVGCLPTLRSYKGAEEVFKTVASTTRGLYLPLSQAPVLIPIITGVAETELDRQRIEEHIAEVLARHEAQLAHAAEEERVRFVTDVLRDQRVRPRSLVYDPNRPGPSPLRFRDLTADDVQAGLDQLRRLGRTAL
jgi:Ca-activated chloride channel family protein